MKKDYDYTKAEEVAFKERIPLKIGAGCECCGTEVLRDYKLLGCDSRSTLFDNKKGSEKFERCFVNFVRNNKNKDKTIAETCSCKNCSYITD